MTWAFRIFVALYAIALLLLAIGTFGWFGQEKDPLSAVFLFPLGLPWNLLADKAGIAGPVAVILAPAVTAAILWWLAYRRKRSATLD
ncbi:MAG: hypothetical protein ACK4NZ_07740 [Tsuneonella sp.]